jgi:hypothetical protein
VGVLRSFREARAPALLFTLWSIWGLAFAMGEVIPVNEGLGWDGVRFAKMVERGPALLEGREINSYYVQRVGPSFAVRLMLMSLGLSPESGSIRLGFVVLNLTLLSLALVLLMNAAEAMALSASGRWVLFLGLFANQANGRLPVYYAPIGDSTAFFLGALALWAHVLRRPFLLGSVFLLAIVSWPAAFLLLPLLVWPRPRAEAARGSESASLSAFWRWGTLAAALPLGLGLLAVIEKVAEMPAVGVWPKETILAVATNGWQLGCAAGFFLALAVVHPNRLRSWPSLKGAIAAVGLVGLGALYVRRFESGSLAFSGVTFLREVLLFARSSPFAALVGHASYYSGLAVAAAAVWPRVLREGVRIGPGAFVATGLIGLMALDAESRRLNAYWPLVAFLAVMALEPLWSSRTRLFFFCVATLALSKLWWPLTGPALFTAAHEPGNYFNTQGPSMSRQAILFHAAAALALGLWVCFSMGGRRLRSESRRE